MSPRDIGAAEYRRHWIQQSDQLFQALTGIDRLDKAVVVLRERRARLPDDPRVALGVAGELAAAAVMSRPGQPLLAAARDGERLRYLVEALAAWREAARIVAREPYLVGPPSGSPSRPRAGGLHSEGA